MGKHNYATVSWIPEDVIENARELGLEVKKREATLLLRRAERRIAAAMVETGWSVILEELDA
jgi:hypothetical protein